LVFYNDLADPSSTKCATDHQALIPELERHDLCSGFLQISPTAFSQLAVVGGQRQASFCRLQYEIFDMHRQLGNYDMSAQSTSSYSCIQTSPIKLICRADWSDLCNFIDKVAISSSVTDVKLSRTVTASGALGGLCVSTLRARCPARQARKMIVPLATRAPGAGVWTFWPLFSRL